MHCKMHTEITPHGELKSVHNWILQTEGVNLKEVLSERSVDPFKTTSNHIVEIYSVSTIQSQLLIYVPIGRRLFASASDWHNYAGIGG